MTTDMSIADQQLFEAIRAEDENAVRAAFAAGAKPCIYNNCKASPLGWCWSWNGGMDIIKTIIEHPDFNADLSVTQGVKQFPLIMVANCGYTDMATWLLDAGADLEITNKYRLTALHLTATHSHPNITSLLLARGCNPNPQDTNGNTPAHYAAYMINTPKGRQIVNLLEQAGADFNIPNKENKTANQILAEQKARFKRKWPQFTPNKPA